MLLRLHSRLRSDVHWWVQGGGAEVQRRRWGAWFAVSCVVAWACTFVLSRLGPVLDLGPTGQSRLLLVSFMGTLTGALAWATVAPGQFSSRAVLVSVGAGLAFWVLVAVVLI